MIVKTSNDEKFEKRASHQFKKLYSFSISIFKYLNLILASLMQFKTILINLQ